MKTKTVAISFLLFALATNLVAQDTYNDMLDSLLVNMGKLIFNDLSNDNLKILERSHIGFGDSFELKVIFDERRTEILTYLNRPDSINKKFKFNNRKHKLKYIMFGNYITDHNKLPYDLFDSFSYKFMQVQTKGETFGDAMFGEYKFKAAPEGLTIIDKKIEILTGEKSILEKHNSDW